MRPVVRPLAAEDLERIKQEGERLFGPVQARTYAMELRDRIERIAETPHLFRERRELNPPIRTCPHKSHVILYRVEGDEIIILRVRHGREDWLSEDR